MEKQSSPLLPRCGVNQDASRLYYVDDEKNILHIIVLDGNKKRTLQFPKKLKIVELNYNIQLILVVFVDDPTKIHLYDCLPIPCGQNEQDVKMILPQVDIPRMIAQVTFISPILKIASRRDIFLVALEREYYLYKYETFKMIDHQYFHAPFGGALAIHKDFIAYGDRLLGELLIRDNSGNIMYLHPHNSDIASISISQNGYYIATASHKGTVIRIIDRSSGDIIKELRRGYENSEITSMSFSANNLYIAVISKKGTLHVFDLRKENTSYFNLAERTELKYYIPYVSEKYVVFFASNDDNTVYVVIPEYKKIYRLLLKDNVLSAIITDTF
jgi:hypothetical protein